MNELYAKKIGMTQIFDTAGRVVPVTILELEPNVVIAEKTKDRAGYDAKVLAAFEQRPERLSKARIGMFSKEIKPCSLVFESKGFQDKNIGDSIGVECFEQVLFVDVTGVSKGKGFQGVMRRHGASGGPAKHGSKFHRHIGSSGQSADPSRIRKGTKAPGRTGNKTVTLQNLRVIDVDKEKSRVIIQGAVPGAVNARVRIRPAIKKDIHIVSEQA